MEYGPNLLEQFDRYTGKQIKYLAKSPEYQLTIVVPVYNEQENLDKFKQEMNHYLENTPLKSKVLFIDDGSVDGSLNIIKTICQNNQDYFYAVLSKNYGLSAALKTGFDLCDTHYVGYIDADLQTLPEDFITYFQYLDKYNMVNGIRVHRSDTFVKRLTSYIANAFRRFMINDGIADTCCPLKIIETSMVQKIPFFKGMHRFIPALIQLYGGKVKQVPVRHFPRYAGKSKYHLFNRLFGPFVDTLVFVWMRKRIIRYRIKESDFIHV